MVPGGALLASLGLPIIAALSSACTFSWKYLKLKDKGEGIILAATWLIPIAIVPRSLEAKEWATNGEGAERGEEVKVVSAPAVIAGGEYKSKEQGTADATVSTVSFANKEQLASVEPPKRRLLQRIRSKGGKK